MIRPSDSISSLKSHVVECWFLTTDLSFEAVTLVSDVEPYFKFTFGMCIIADWFQIKASTDIQLMALSVIYVNEIFWSKKIPYFLFSGKNTLQQLSPFRSSPDPHFWYKLKTSSVLGHVISSLKCHNQRNIQWSAIAKSNAKLSLSIKVILSSF